MRIGAILILVLFPLQALPATRTWDGGAGDGLWSNPTNWDSNIAFVVNDDVVFSAGTWVSTNDVGNVGTLYGVPSGYNRVYFNQATSLTKIYAIHSGSCTNILYALNGLVQTTGSWGIQIDYVSASSAEGLFSFGSGYFKLPSATWYWGVVEGGAGPYRNHLSIDTEAIVTATTNVVLGSGSGYEAFLTNTIDVVGKFTLGSSTAKILLGTNYKNKPTRSILNVPGDLSVLTSSIVTFGADNNNVDVDVSGKMAITTSGGYVLFGSMGAAVNGTNNFVFSCSGGTVKLSSPTVYCGYSEAASGVSTNNFSYSHVGGVCTNACNLVLGANGKAGCVYTSLYSVVSSSVDLRYGTLTVGNKSVDSSLMDKASLVLSNNTGTIVANALIVGAVSSNITSYVYCNTDCTWTNLSMKASVDRLDYVQPAGVARVISSATLDTNSFYTIAAGTLIMNGLTCRGTMAQNGGSVYLTNATPGFQTTGAYVFDAGDLYIKGDLSHIADSTTWFSATGSGYLYATTNEVAGQTHVYYGAAPAPSTTNAASRVLVPAPEKLVPASTHLVPN